MSGSKEVICICGGGNAAHVLAGHFGSRGFVVNVFTLEREAKLWKKEITVYEPKNLVTKGEVNLVSPDPKLCAENADCVFLTGPSHVNYYYLEQIGPYVEDECIVGAIFGQGGADWAIGKYFGEDYKKKKLSSFILQICPWACRIEKYGESVNIFGEKLFHMSVFPEGSVEKVHPFASRLFDREIRLLPNTLHLHFTPANQVLHPTRFYSLFKDWKEGMEYTNEEEKYRNVLLFYEEMDEEACELMKSVCSEMKLLKEEICKNYPELDLKNMIHSTHDLLVHWYQDQIVDQSTLMSSCRTNKAYKGIRSPLIKIREEEGGKEVYVPDFKSRYLWEDIPYGLLVLHNFGEIVKVRTPNIDKIILWGQEKMGVKYLVKEEGEEVYKMTDDSNLLKKTGTPKRYGIQSLEELIKRALWK